MSLFQIKKILSLFSQVKNHFFGKNGTFFSFVPSFYFQLFFRKMLIFLSMIFLYLVLCFENYSEKQFSLDIFLNMPTGLNAAAADAKSESTLKSTDKNDDKKAEKSIDKNTETNAEKTAVDKKEKTTSKNEKEEEVWELAAYDVQLVLLDNSELMTSNERKLFQKSIEQSVQACFKKLWNVSWLEIAEEDQAEFRNSFDQLVENDLSRYFYSEEEKPVLRARDQFMFKMSNFERLAFDKTFFLLLNRDAETGKWAVSVREWDRLSQRLGDVQTFQTIDSGRLSDLVLQGLLEVFSPWGKLTVAEGRNAELRLRGSELYPYPFAWYNRVFLPFVLRKSPESVYVQKVAWTYLVSPTFEESMKLNPMSDLSVFVNPLPIDGLPITLPEIFEQNSQTEQKTAGSEQKTPLKSELSSEQKPLSQNADLKMQIYTAMRSPLSVRRRGRFETLAMMTHPKIQDVPIQLTCLNRPEKNPVICDVYEVFPASVFSSSDAENNAENSAGKGTQQEAEKTSETVKNDPSSVQKTTGKESTNKTDVAKTDADKTDAKKAPSKPASVRVRRGRTDYNGQFLLNASSNPGNRPIRVVLFQSGEAVLAQVPVVPGLQNELIVPITDDEMRLQLETLLMGMRESLVDFVAERELLNAQISLYKGKQSLSEKEKEELATAQRQLGLLSQKYGLRRRLSQLKNGEFYNAIGSDRRVKRMFQDIEKLMGEFQVR